MGFWDFVFLIWAVKNEKAAIKFFSYVFMFFVVLVVFIFVLPIFGSLFDLVFPGTF